MCAWWLTRKTPLRSPSFWRAALAWRKCFIQVRFLNFNEWISCCSCETSLRLCWRNIERIYRCVRDKIVLCSPSQFATPFSHVVVNLVLYWARVYSPQNLSFRLVYRTEVSSPVRPGQTADAGLQWDGDVLHKGWIRRIEGLPEGSQGNYFWTESHRLYLYNAKKKIK